MTFRVAVTGIDGVGKTTAMLRLAANLTAEDPGDFSVRCLMTPRHSLDADLPFAMLGGIFEKMGRLADERGDPSLKAQSLFLTMTLFGNLEDHIESIHQPEVLLTERQCLIDTLVFASHYLPLLRAVGASDREAAPGSMDFERLLSSEELRAFQGWQQVITRRLGVPGRPPALSQLMLASFAGPRPTVIANLMAVYAARLPDLVLLLTISESALRERLAGKLRQVQREVHEDISTLLAMQEGFRRTLHGLVDYETIDVSSMTPDETASALQERLPRKAVH